MTNFTNAAERPLDDLTSVRLTWAQTGRATQVALRVSRALLDRWSLALLMEELLEALAGTPVRRKTADSWAAMRRHELAELTDQQYLRHKTFWAEMLKEAPSPVYFARRSRALAPFGCGLNRGPTARLHATFVRDTTTTEAELLADFVQALAHTTGASAFIVACAHNSRVSDAMRTLVGPLATALPLVCRLQGARDLLARRLARDLQHARAHAAFDLALCEEAFSPGWRAGNIATLQFGFSYLDDTIVPPALLAAPTCHFGSLTTHQSKDSDVIANDVHLSVSLTGDTAYAELAYDSDAVEPEFVEALFEAFLQDRSSLHERRAGNP